MNSEKKLTIIFDGLSDVFWRDILLFLRENMCCGERAIVPSEMQQACVLFFDAYGEQKTNTYHWLVIHKGMLEDVRLKPLLSALLFLNPVHANEVFVVFCSRTDLPVLPKTHNHLRALHQRIRFPEAATSAAHLPPVPAREHVRVYLGNHVALTQTQYGHKIFVDTRDTSVAPHMLFDGKWEDWISRHIPDLIRPGDTVVEVGANVGYYTLLACSLVGPSGRVLAFEANPDLSSLLFRSVEVNGFLDRCEIVGKAVSQKSQKLRFRRWKNHMASSSLHPFDAEYIKRYQDEVDEIEVESISLDEQLIGLNRLDFIKIDAEGSEPWIFEGMQETLRRFPAVKIIFEYADIAFEETIHSNLSPWLEQLYEQGFQFQRIDPGGLIPIPQGEPINTQGHTCDILIQKKAQNTVPRPGLPDRPSAADFQKISDYADFEHPLIRRALQTLHLQNKEGYSQRHWEFAMAYAALETLGYLLPGKTGVSFGAGREPLIYAISRHVRKLFATDLYHSQSNWKEAQTSSPRDHVLTNPLLDSFNPDSIEVLDMDMRHPVMENESVDFAYSISSMEHIGSDVDFLQHLSEVRRILKKDGVYLLTTTLQLKEKTIEQIGTWMFSLEKLLGLFAQAGLEAESSLNLRISDHLENTPNFMSKSWAQVPLDATLRDKTWIRYYSTFFTSVLFILKPGQPGKTRQPVIHGLEDTRSSMEVLGRQDILNLWQSPKKVSTRVYPDFLAEHPEYFCITEGFFFQGRDVECRLEIQNGEEAYQARMVFFVCVHPTDSPHNVTHESHTFFNVDLQAGQTFHHHFPFKTNLESGYSVMGKLESASPPPAFLSLWLGFAVSCQDVSTDRLVKAC
jgi:FkbM family methyltransferase